MGKNFLGVYNPGPAYVAANTFVTADITASAKTSPQTVTAAAVTTLTVPHNATEIVITTITFPVKVSNVSDCSTYLSVPIGAVVTLPVSTLEFLYFKGDGGSAVVSFVFNCI